MTIWPHDAEDEFAPYLAKQLLNPEVRAAYNAEPCPVGKGEHCAHWFDGEPCCFCHLDGPPRAPEVVDVLIPGVSK